MKRHAHLNTVFAALATIAVVASGTGAVAQSLGEEITVLLSTNPQIKAARENVAASEEAVNGAFGDYLPQVEARGNFGYERIDSPGRRAAVPDQGPFTTGGARQTTVTITQHVFDGFRSESNNEGARLRKNLSEADLERNVQDVLREGVDAYLLVLRDQRLVQLSGDQEANIKQQLELEDERVRRGSGITVDVLEAKARLQVARERRVAFEGAFEDSISRYIELFGHAPLISELTMPTPPLALLPETLEDAQAVAAAEHPQLSAANTQIDIAQTERRLAKSEFYPDVDLVGEWTYEDNFDGVSDARRDYKAKVEATWQLFNGFSSRALVAQRSHEYRSSVDSSNFVNREVLAEVRRAWFALETARERVRLLQNAVNIASEVYDARRRLREAGKETVINVLDAENELFNARINLVAAQHDARATVYRVLHAMGRLTQDSISNLAVLDFEDGQEVAANDDGITAPAEDRTAAANETRDSALGETAAVEPAPAVAPAVVTAKAPDPSVDVRVDAHSDTAEPIAQPTPAPDATAMTSVSESAAPVVPKNRPGGDIVQSVTQDDRPAPAAASDQGLAARAVVADSSPTTAVEAAAFDTVETGGGATNLPSQTAAAAPVVQRVSVETTAANDGLNFNRLWPYE
jgi:adhesin transport system outer membrane protein